VTVGIIDYGLGNKRSVAGAVEAVGGEPLITGDPALLATCDRLILPGVGAFGDGMANLAGRGLIEVLDRLVNREGRPLLGICLGAQLLARESTEFGHHAGLGWVPARVEAIVPDDPALRVPHVGWNDMIQTRPSPLFRDIPEQSLFYYVHSFRIMAEDEDMVTGSCDYGGRFVAAFQWRNIFGTQFHPEKSQRHGLTVLTNFMGL
jgi:glutamine amidotransferase